MEKCVNIEKNSAGCPCAHNCERHGFCCECIRAHREIGAPVFCMEQEELEKSKKPA